ncbi:MAG: DUF4340 domain-containing protein [Desulfobacteraceae bacterium]|nr:MAG: DUF4340 domain-containing protein [Desulfobacteraceae bacterium]
MHKDLRLRGIIVFGLVFIGLCGLLWWEDRPVSPLPVKGDRLIVFDPADAVWLELSSAGASPIRCEKKAAGWVLVRPEPEGVRADAREIAGILEALSKARIVDVIARAPKDLAGFGFDAPPAAAARIGLKDGEKLSIACGSDIPLNLMYVYGRSSASPDLYMLFNGVRQAIRKSPFELRDRRVLSFDPDRIYRIEIASNGKRINLERKPSWQITDPLKTLADQEKVSALIEKFARVEMKAIFPEKTDRPEAIGLAPPRVELRLWSSDIEEPIRLRLGAPGDSGGVYAQSDRIEEPFLLENLLQEHLSNRTEKQIDRIAGDPMEDPIKDPIKDLVASLAETRALVFDRSRISFIRWESGGIEVALEREEDGSWNLRKPFHALADESAVDMLLRGISSLRVTGFPEQRAFAEKTLPPGSLKIGLENREGGEQVLELAPGADAAAYLGRSSLHARGFDADPAMAAALFDLDPEKLRDRHLLRFDPVRIERIEIRYPDRRITCEKKGGFWQITQPSLGIADGPLVWKMLFALVEARFERIAGDGRSPCDSAASPSLEILLWQEAAESADTLKVVLDGGRQAVALSSTAGGCLIAPAAVFEGLPQSAGELVFRR